MIKAKPLLPFVLHGCKGLIICFDENFKLIIYILIILLYSLIQIKQENFIIAFCENVCYPIIGFRGINNLYKEELWV